MKKLFFILVIGLTIGCIDQSDDVSLLPKEEVLEIFEDNITGEVSIDFQTYNGHIETNFWDRPSYRIEATKWARASTSQEAKEKAQDVYIGFSIENGNGSKTLVFETEETLTAGVEVRAFLPENLVNIDISTFNGDITIEDIHASNVSVTTANGDIRAVITADTINIKTSNGKIQGFYQGHHVFLETVNGRINVELGDFGEYDLETRNGDIDIRVDTEFDFNLKTSLGDITVLAEKVSYIVEEPDHYKGYTAKEASISINASTIASSITVVKQ
ncbi:MAG: DUF4097 family beta strand repeat-containing protein [Candidatus Methanofastidiosia archaeon]|jgi:DUF4097 and DUF4098 domain-containing protein YvlB